MSDPKQARLLLAAAEEDLSALRGQKDAAVFTDRVFGFAVQQATEKALKACICLSGSMYPHTHDLGVLFDVLGQHEKELSPYAGLIQYTGHAGALRYPPTDPKGRPLDRDDAIVLVESLLEKVRRHAGDT